MPKDNPFRDVHYLAWDDVQSRQLGQEGRGVRLNILFQCPNPACGRKASVSVVKACGRCFHCPWTFYVYDRPPSVLDTQYRIDPDRLLAWATPKVHLDIQPLTARATTYLATRGLSSDTIQHFVPFLFECCYANRHCLGWYTTTHDVYELRELRMGSSFKSAVNGKELTCIPLAASGTDIVLTEGLISALSYAQLRQKFDCLYLVLNSVTSFGKLARYDALLYAHQVIVALDNDPDGRATLDLFRGVHHKDVTIDMPATDGADWNDILCATLPLLTHAPLEQFDWTYDDRGRIRFDRSAAAVAQRTAYLERVDARLRVSYHDIEDLVHQPGKRVVCWSASSGKTSAIRQFIVRHYGEFILYAARTIAEIERLAYDIGCFIGFDNVLTLSAELETYQEYATDPRFVHNVPVLLVTHERLCLDPPGLLCRLPSYHGQMQAESGRTYILIDEHPQTFKKLTLSQEQQALVTQVCGGRFDAASARTFESLLDRENPVAAHGAHVVRRMLSQRTHDDLLSRYRAFHWIDMIAAQCRALSCEDQHLRFDPTKTHDFVYYYTLSDLDYNMTIFDGTGDLSLPHSPVWTIIKPKHLSYQFRGNVTHLKEAVLTMLPRSPTSPTQQRSHEYTRWLDQQFLPCMTTLSRKHAKMLVITWKDFKGVVETLVDKVDVQSPYNTLHRETPKTRITLDQRLLISLQHHGMTNVVATYYQSGKTRGTSEFAECDAVLFLGTFFIPNYALTEYNQLTRAHATKYTWTVAELIQGAYRSCIRHERPVDIYFSWDWPTAVVQAFAQYLDLKTVYRSDFALRSPAEQLRLFLDPDPRAERVFAFLATQAQALLTSKVATYTITPSVLTNQRQDHLVRSVNRILGKHGVATWISSRLGVLLVQLYYRPTDVEIAYTYEPDQRASG